METSNCDCLISFFKFLEFTPDLMAGRQSGWNDDVGVREPIERSHQKVQLVQLIKHHLRDWLWVTVMIILETVVYFAIPPFQRFVDEHKMQEYMYPTSPETVPVWAIGVRVSFQSHFLE